MSILKNWSKKEKLALIPWGLFALLMALYPVLTNGTLFTGHNTEYSTSGTRSLTAKLPIAGEETKTEVPILLQFAGRRLKPVGLALSDDSGIDPNTCTYHRDGDWWEYHSMFFGHLRGCEDERSKDLSRRSGAVPAVDQMPPCDIRIVNKKIWYGYMELTCQKVWFPHEATPTYAWRPEVGLPCDAKHEGSGLVVRSGDDSDWAKIQCTHTPDGDYGWVTIDEKVLAQCLPDGSMPPGERACTDAPVEGTDRKKLSKPTFHPDPNSVWI